MRQVAVLLAGHQQSCRREAEFDAHFLNIGVPDRHRHREHPETIRLLAYRHPDVPAILPLGGKR
jgi:hypothetical protein